MKYRNITLNGNKENIISFIKYEPKYKFELITFEDLNKSLKEAVINCPKIYSEKSDHQSYMIFKEESSCIGAIYIGTSIDEKNLEIELQFNNNCFYHEIEIYPIINQIVDSLCLFFYDKENIEIKLINQIDLSQYRPSKYQKKIYDDNLTTYIYSNNYYHKLIPLLFDEMNSAENTMTNCGLYWTEILKENNKLTLKVDKDLIKEYRNGTISREDIFCKLEWLLWTDIKSNKNIRDIRFNIDGNIHLHKEKRSYYRQYYNFNYNLLREGFDFEYFDNDNIIEFEDNYFYRRITTKYRKDKENKNVKGNINVTFNKEEHKTNIEYTGAITNNTSIYIQIMINEQNEIERYYVDFKTHRNRRHKRRKKVNGLYALRIIPKYNKYDFSYISRNGSKGFNQFDRLLKEEKEIIIDNKLTEETIDMIFKKIITILNNLYASSNQKYYFNDEEAIFEIMNIENNITNLLKQIKGEIPLPTLQDRINTLIEEQEINKKDTKEDVKIKSRKLK